MLSPARITTTFLLSAATLLTGHAWAIDWDGDFAGTGSFDGKIDNPLNWDTNTLPGPTTSVLFDAAATYTVGFGVDFETGGGAVINGDVTFLTLGGTPVYSVNGNYVVTGALTLEGVDVRSGTTTPLGLFTEGGGSITLQNGDVSVVDLLRVAPDVSAGTMTIDSTTVQVDSSILIYGNGVAGGGLLTLQNGADVQVINGTQVQLGRSMNVASTLRVLSGASLYAEADLFMADFDFFNGTAVLELIGTGSSFELAGGYDAVIGADAMSSARFTGFDNTSADFGGQLTVRATGTLENMGSAFTIDGTTQIDGTFRHSAGTTDFNGEASFGSGATFIHNGGTIRFNDDTTVGILDVTTGAPASSNPAAWEVNADVAYNRLLRLAGDNGTWASVTVSDDGGTDAVLRNTGTGGQADLAVGYNGNGQLFINENGLVDIYDDVIIGQNAGSNGQVFVTGDGTFNLTDRSELRVNRNGSGSNVFVGFSGAGLLNVTGGGLIEVGNDLVIMLSDVAGVSSSVTVGVSPTLELDSIDTVNVGNDLLIGNAGNNGGTSSGLFWLRDRAVVTVDGTTHVRATGELRADYVSTLTTTNLTTDAGAILDIDGGQITVNGGIATLNHGDLVVNGQTGVPLGLGMGRFSLINGADATVAGDIVLGEASGDHGLLVVNGVGSTLNQTNGLRDARVGDGGIGEFQVFNGGFAEINRSLFVASASGATATVHVSGVQSGIRSHLLLEDLGDISMIEIGSNLASGWMNIANGGFVQVTGGVTVGSLTSTITGSHLLTIGGSQDGFAAELLADYLYISGPDAELQLNDGGLVILETFTAIPSSFIVNGGSTLQMTGGDLYVENATIIASAIIQWTGGAIHAMEINGGLTNQGGTLAPDLSPANRHGTTTITGDYTQLADATLALDLGGTTRGSSYDYLEVDGEFNADGTLEVSLIDGFNAALGHSFDLIDVSGGPINGTFSALLLPGVGNGNTWDLTQLYSTGTITVIRSGDLDSDGTVGVADLDIILANWGQSVTPFDETQGDVNGDGLVGDADLQAVLDQFGNTTYPTSSSVPEPGTLSMLVLLLFGRRRRGTTR